MTIFCAKKNFLSFGDIFPFSNAFAIQINLGTNYLLKKTVLEKMGYWQKELEFGKKVGCFKAPLGSLGLTIMVDHEVLLVVRGGWCLTLHTFWHL